jgi:hypothetical protein
MTGYVKDIVLSEKSLQQARDYYKNSKEWYSVWQYYNLFHLERLDIPTEDYELEFLKELHTYSRKSKNIGSYFLRYPPNSFTRMHQDNNSELTIVTLLDSENLVGGDCVIESEYESPGPRPRDYHCARHPDPEKNKQAPYGLHIVPDIVKLDDGQSMIYGPDLRHGVTKVYQGERVVLISWFRNGEDKTDET